MSNAKPYLLGGFLGASAMYVVLQYHVVHSHDGFQMVPRTPQHSVGLAYADVRNWSPSQWTDRPELARALMAHGSSDLISKSVASSLADSVTEENSTLDQLRSFLEKSTQGGIKGTTEGLLEIPSSTHKPSTPDSSAEDDLTRIPFPLDAKNKVPADPFRVAQGSEAPVAAVVQDPPRLAGTSRFTAADVIDGLHDNADDRMDSFSASAPRSTSGTNTSGRAAAGNRTTAQHAQAMEERIFGNSGSTAENSFPVTSAADDSMFEEVSTELENRAQASLNRAKKTSTDKAVGVIDEAKRPSESYKRKQIEDAAPDAVKSVIKNGTVESSTKSAGSLLEQFDPFLE